MKRLAIQVSGKVQGVFYRASTEKKAKELGLTGFVRNEPDGSVYIEAQGEDSLLNQFVDWCRKGPDRARVDSVKLSEKEVLPEVDFSIQRY